MKRMLLLTSYFSFFTFFCFSQNAGDKIFNSSSIHTINIILTQPNWWDSLTYYYNDGATQYMIASVTFDSLQLDSVGIRLKGNSSYGHDGTKKPIKLDLDRFISTQEIDGMSKINLNNGFLDPSMMREKLFLDFINKEGLPSPRCTYARVSYNGKYCGLYKIVEQVDKTFLKTHFGNKDGNLFKGDPNGTLEQKGTDPNAYYKDYELKTNNSVNNWSDLVNFIQVVNSDQSVFSSQIKNLFDASSYLKAWAANNLFVNLDAYYYYAHNYYLYHNTATSQFDWITWDVSVVFGVFPLWSENKVVNLDLLYVPQNASTRPLSKNFMDNNDFRFEYLSDVCNYIYNDFTPANLFPKIDSIAGRIRNDIYAEPDSNQAYTEEEFEQNINYGTVSSGIFWGDVPGLKQFIINRRQEAIVQLCEKGWSCASNSLSGDGAIVIYPNPTFVDITLRFDLVEDDAPITYSILDLSGKEMLSETVILPRGIYLHTLNIEKLAAGVYILKIANSCKKFNKKLVVIK
ncbi:MAG: CotH kinase family protein [Bacteroidetes bacterium]|nr:CotH kinase family protein [Bacteroidota bacterium]